MNARVFIATLVLGALLLPATADARDCPSRLPAHPYALGDYVELGAEVRAFYFGIDVGEGLPSSPTTKSHEWQNNVFTGLRPMLVIYPLEELTLIFEPELRYIWPGWEGKPVEGFDARLVQALLEYDPGDWRLTAGVQGLNFGTAALLDQRFLAVSAEFRSRPATVEIFGGSIWRRVMRNAANSMWMRYISQSTAWKFISEELQENWVAGAILNLRVAKPQRMRLLYLYTHPFQRELRTHSIALHFSGPIVRRRLSYEIEPMVVIHQDDGYTVPLVVGEMRGHPMKSRSGPVLRLRLASALRDVAKRPAMPVYENLSWGTIRRYSVHDGHVAGFSVHWPVSPYAEPFAEYYAQTRDFEHMSDEFDLGVQLAIGELYRLRLAYIGFNYANSLRPSHAAYAELRIVIGEE